MYFFESHNVYGREGFSYDREKNHIEDRIFSSTWIFFNPLRTLSVSPWQAAWNLYMIWLGPNSLQWRNIRPSQGWEGHLSNRVLRSLFYVERYPQMNEIFPYQQDHSGKNISWEHKLLFFQLQEKTLKLKSMRSSQSSHSEDSPITWYIFNKHCLLIWERETVLG